MPCTPHIMSQLPEFALNTHAAQPCRPPPFLPSHSLKPTGKERVTAGPEEYPSSDPAPSAHYQFNPTTPRRPSDRGGVSGEPAHLGGRTAAGHPPRATLPSGQDRGPIVAGPFTIGNVEFFHARQAAVGSGGLSFPFFSPPPPLYNIGQKMTM